MNRHKQRQEDFCTQFEHLSVQDQPSTSQGHRGHSRRVAPPKASSRNPNLFQMNYHENKPVSYRNVQPTEEIYKKIKGLITNDTFIVENIVEINNPFLQKAYDLKKSQKQKRFGEVYESLLFHGCKKANIGSICTHNFDWRLFGTNTGHRYGKGVSFSTNAKYASFYSDPGDYHKVMIVAKVLIANVCQGHSEMEYPPPGFDTSQKGNSGAVIVKYEDHEFYPAYKLHYHLEEQQEEEEDYDEYDDGAYDLDQYEYEYEYDENDYNYTDIDIDDYYNQDNYYEYDD